MKGQSLILRDKERTRRELAKVMVHDIDFSG